MIRAGAAAALAVATAACGHGPAAAPPTPRAPHPVSSAPPAPRAASSASAPPRQVASFEDLLARGAAVAPLMHEGPRIETSAARARTPIEASHDLCARAVFAASGDVVVHFEGKGHARLGDAASGAEGAAPPAGPVCVRKGEELAVAIDRLDAAGGSPGAQARVVVFVSP